jgi:hypothetical protein
MDAKVLKSDQYISELIKDIPEGSWVALSDDQERVVAYAEHVHDAIELAKQRGEDDPILMRVPLESNQSWI